SVLTVAAPPPPPPPPAISPPPSTDTARPHPQARHQRPVPAPTRSRPTVGDEPRLAVARGPARASSRPPGSTMPDTDRDLLSGITLRPRPRDKVERAAGAVSIHGPA